MADHSALESITPSEFSDAFVDFLKEYSRERIEEILAGEDDLAPYSVPMCMQYLLDHNPTLGMLLLQHPNRLMSLADQAIQTVQKEWLDSDAHRNSSSLQWSLKDKVYCRIQDMPPIPQLRKPNISCLRSTDVGGLLEVSGTVIRTGMVKLLERTKTYTCGSSRCKHKFTVSADLMQGNILIPPTACPSNTGNLCKSTTFQQVEDETLACDYQEIKIQEQVQNLAVGSIPRSIIVVLVDDLVDSCKPGDDVVVVGLMIRRWQPCYPQVRTGARPCAHGLRCKHAYSPHAMACTRILSPCNGLHTHTLPMQWLAHVHAQHITHSRTLANTLPRTLAHSHTHSQIRTLAHSLSPSHILANVVPCYVGAV
jgi:DNA helicase MCM9